MKCSSILFSITFLIMCLVFTSESAKVLGLFTTFSPSHLIIHKAVMQTLIDKGHDVTIVTTLPMTESNKTYRHVHLDVPPMPTEYLNRLIADSTGPISVFSAMLKQMESLMQYSNSAVTHPKMKRLLAEESFDLMVLGFFANTFELGVGAHFKCPIAISFMHRPISVISKMIGNPLESTYVPHLVTGINDQRMGFAARLKNAIITVVDGVLVNYFEYRADQLYSESFPAHKYPPLKEMYRNVSLVLSSYHFSNGIIKPDVPGLVEIGGIQIKPTPDPLSDVS